VIEHVIVRFRDESFQAISCTAVTTKSTVTKNIKYTKAHKKLMQANWP